MEHCQEEFTLYYLNQWVVYHLNVEKNSELSTMEQKQKGELSSNELFAWFMKDGNDTDFMRIKEKDA